MVCISLGTVDKTLIVIIVGCIICFLNRILVQIEASKMINENLIINNILMSLSRFLTIVPYIILKIRSKRKNKSSDIENPNHEKKLLYNDQVKKAAKGKWGYILLSGFIFLLVSISLTASFKINTNAWIWYILFASLFYYLIFKNKLYRHHYLSIVSIILLGLVIDLITGYIQKEIVDDTLLLFLKFLKQIFFALYNVIAKYVMEKKYVSVYEFSFYVGLFNLIVFLIFSIFDYYFLKWTKFMEYFDNFDITQLFIILGIVFTQLGINITSLFTAKNNSPCHVFIIFVFGQIAYYVYFSGDFKLIIILITIFILVIILFLSLIFNEIIEINFCKLSYNTKRNIMKRAEDDVIFKSDNDSLNESNSKNESRSSNDSDNKGEEIKEINEKDENLIGPINKQIIEDDNYYFKI